MRKYLVLSFIFVFLVLFLLINNESYAYDNCNYKYIYPSELTTLNLKDYLDIMNFKEVYRFCSYDKCYTIKESNISKSIENFKIIYDKQLMDDEYLEIRIKGYPITELIINAC